MGDDNWLRHEVSRLAAEVEKLQRELAREKFVRLTIEIDAAIAANDGVSWARAVKERVALGLAEHEIADFWPKREAV